MLNFWPVIRPWSQHVMVIHVDYFYYYYVCRTHEDEREWVRGLWNTWFDQVFPPTPEDSENEDDGNQGGNEEGVDERDGKKGLVNEERMKKEKQN